MYIGIDIGGTSCRVAATSNLEHITNFTRKEFKLTHNFDNDFSTLLGLMKELSQNNISAIGMGIPGDLNENKTAFTNPAKNLSEWGDKPIKELLQKTFNCQVFLENDAAAAGLGEAVYGSVRDGDFAFIIWGTGIGGALVRKDDGVYVSKKLNWHNYFKDWEEYCGGNKIRERYAVAAGDLAEEEWQQVMEDFRNHLSNFLEKTHAKHIIFGGGIAIKQSKRLLALQEQFPSVIINVSSLGENCGLYGSFALIKNSL